MALGHTPSSAEPFSGIPTMFFLLSGASASGKKTTVRAVIPRVDNLEGYHDNRFAEEWGLDRLDNLERWVDMAIELQEDGVDLLIGGNSPLGELLAVPRSIHLDGIAACLLDCYDFNRFDRFVERGEDPDDPPGLDHYCWAAYHRLHSRSPRWEQHVCTERPNPQFIWSRWLDWPAGDPRWVVPIIDNTRLSVDKTASRVAEWIEEIRSCGPPLTREAEWWES